MNTDREKWIDEVLHSADTLGRLPSGTIARRVLARVRSRSINPVSATVVWRMAASVVILLVLNIAVIYSYHIQTVESTREVQLQSLAKEYGLTDNNSESTYE